MQANDTVIAYWPHFERHAMRPLIFATLQATGLTGVQFHVDFCAIDLGRMQISPG